MNAFITTLAVQTNPLSLEKIIFGLLGVSDQAIYFHTSDHKLSVAEQLLGKPVLAFAKRNLLSLRATVNSQNKAIKTELFGKSQSPFNASYIGSLAQYSNGLIQFGEVMPVAGELPKSQFVQLYEQFVGEPYTPTSTGRGAFARLVKKTLNIPNLAHKADINYWLKPDRVQGLLKPTNVTLLTTHKALIAYQQIDFTNTESVIANNLYEFEAVADVLNSYSKAVFNQHGQFHVIAQPPSEKSPQYKQYITVKKRKQNVFTLVGMEQFAESAQRIAQNGHQKASEVLENL